MNSKLIDRVERERQWHDDRFSLDNRSEMTGKFYFALKEWFSDYLVKASNPKVKNCLELGAGLETISLSESFHFSLSSIDISHKAIDHLKILQIENKVNFELMDVHDMAYESDSFDRVVGRGVLHHLDLSVALPEIIRVLKRDGSIVFGEPLAGNPFINLYRRLTPSLRTPDEQPLKHVDLVWIKNSFAGASITYYGFFTLISAILGIKSGRKYFRTADNFVLNKLKLGRFLAWACIIHN